MSESWLNRYTPGTDALKLNITRECLDDCKYSDFTPGREPASCAASKERAVSESEVKVLVRVEVIDNETGESRTFEDSYADREHAEFMYSEGNYACDCNRRIFVDRAAGRETADTKCSSGKFSVRLVDVACGEVFYSD